MKDREKQLEAQGKLAEGAAQAFEGFREGQKKTESFAIEGQKIVQALAARQAEGTEMARGAAEAINSARFALEEYGIQPESATTGAVAKPVLPQLQFMGAAGIHDAARERERREAFQAEKRELKRQYQLGQMNRAVYQQRRLELEEDFRAQQEFQTNKEVFREGVAQIAENINAAGLQFSESIQKAAPGLTQFFDQDLRDVLTSAFQVEAVFDLSEYLETFQGGNGGYYQWTGKVYAEYGPDRSPYQSPG